MRSSGSRKTNKRFEILVGSRDARLRVLTREVPISVSVINQGKHMDNTH